MIKPLIGSYQILDFANLDENHFQMNHFKLRLFFDFNGFCMILWSPIDGCWSKTDLWGIIKPPVHVFKIKYRIKSKCYLFNWLLNCIKLVLNDIKWFIFELFLKNKIAIFGLKIALFQWLNGLMIPFRQVVNSLKKLHFRQKNNIKNFFWRKFMVIGTFNGIRINSILIPQSFNFQFKATD